MSKRLDNLKIDIVLPEWLPLLIQAKVTSTKSIDLTKTVDILKFIHKYKKGIPIVVYKVRRKLVKNYKEHGKLVVLEYSDFMKLIDKLYEHELFGEISEDLQSPES